MKIIRLSCALLALTILFCGAFADETNWFDDSVAELTVDDTGDIVTTPAFNMTHGDVTLGYVASLGASPHPLFCNDRDMISISKLSYECVVELDGDLKPTPNLASSWEQNGKEWTFHIRSGILFHNGFSLSAYDIVASFNAFKSADSTNPYRGRTSYIEKMTATDDYTLTVTGKYEGYITLYAMSFPVMQQYTLEDEIPSGTGPYWCVSLVYNESLRLEANPYWWRKQPNVQSIVCLRYAESAELFEAFTLGKIDMVVNRSAAAAMTSNLTDVASRTFTCLEYEFLLPNLSSGVMTDLSMRQAITYAIDFSDLITTGYHSTCQQCEVPVMSQSWVYESQSASFFYSPERAYKLITELGWEDLNGDGIMNKLNDVKLEELTVRIVTYNDSNSTIRESAANLIAQYLSKVGIKAEVIVLSSVSKMKDRIKAGTYELALLSIETSELPVIRSMFVTDGSANLNNYTSTEMDSLLEAVFSASTETDFKSACSAVQLKVVNDLPIIGIGFRTGRVLSTRSLAGLTETRCYDALNGIEFMPQD